MNYFLDTEFLEGSQKTFFGKTKPTIDLMARQDGTDMVELRNMPNYPKQENEHNALDDAKWNFKLFQFLQGVS
jgi:hypothetical protein